MKTIPALGQGALHTIEHLAATFLRNHPVWGDKIVYWGPMGCLTGNYLLMKGDLESKDIVELMQETFRFVAEFEGEVPGTTPKDCGNCLLHDLPMAKWESARYLHEVLEKMTDKNLYYPQKQNNITVYLSLFALLTVKVLKTHHIILQPTLIHPLKRKDNQ